MIQKFNLEDLTVVDESVVSMAAGHFGPTEDNVFNRVLQASIEFKKAGLTPVFLCTSDCDTLMVTSRERIEKKCH